jgi:hypothetical protein
MGCFVQAKQWLLEVIAGAYANESLIDKAPAAADAGDITHWKATATATPALLNYAKGSSSQPAPTLHIHMEDDHGPADVQLQLAFQPTAVTPDKQKQLGLTAQDAQSIHSIVGATQSPTDKVRISWNQVLTTGLGLFMKALVP